MGARWQNPKQSITKCAPLCFAQWSLYIRPKSCENQQMFYVYCNFQVHLQQITQVIHVEGVRILPRIEKGRDTQKHRNTVLKTARWPDESRLHLSFLGISSYHVKNIDVDFFWHISPPKALRTELTWELPALNLSHTSILSQTCNLKELKRWVMTVAEMTNLFFTLIVGVSETFKEKLFFCHFYMEDLRD